MAAQVEEGPGTARIVVIATLQQGLGLRTPWGSSAFGSDGRDQHRSRDRSTACFGTRGWSGGRPDHLTSPWYRSRPYSYRGSGADLDHQSRMRWTPTVSVAPAPAGAS